tara:strand:+ start:736 stop:1038 length:303 start_codon:yes stop_codon:yes gene_type:complete
MRERLSKSAPREDLEDKSIINIPNLQDYSTEALLSNKDNLDWLARLMHDLDKAGVNKAGGGRRKHTKRRRPTKRRTTKRIKSTKRRKQTKRRAGKSSHAR